MAGSSDADDKCRQNQLRRRAEVTSLPLPIRDGPQLLRRPRCSLACRRVHHGPWRNIPPACFHFSVESVWRLVLSDWQSVTDTRSMAGERVGSFRQISLWTLVLRWRPLVSPPQGFLPLTVENDTRPPFNFIRRGTTRGLDRFCSGIHHTSATTDASGGMVTVPAGIKARMSGGKKTQKTPSGYVAF